MGLVWCTHLDNVMIVIGNGLAPVGTTVAFELTTNVRVMLFAVLKTDAILVSLNASRCKERYCRDGHQYRCQPSETLGGFSIYVLTHDRLVGGDEHGDNDEWRSGDAVDDGNEHQQRYWVHRQKTHHHSTDRSHRTKSVENGSAPRRVGKARLFAEEPSHSC